MSSLRQMQRTLILCLKTLDMYYEMWYNLSNKLISKKENRMSKASELIERLEKETGQRIDSNDGDNLAMVGLLGAMSRIMGKSPASYTERDDVAAGVLIRHQMSPEYKREQESKRMVAEMLASGMSPDAIKSLMK